MKRMNKKLGVLFLIGLLFVVLASCSDLLQELGRKDIRTGDVVLLPHPDGSVVRATVIDSDTDGTPDGLDFDADGVVDLSFDTAAAGHDPDAGVLALTTGTARGTVFLTLSPVETGRVTANADGSGDSFGVMPSAGAPVFGPVLDSSAEATGVQADTAALTAADLVFGSGDSSTSITAGFTVPVAGDNGSAISWSASPAGIVSFSGGTAMLTAPAEDKTVTLYATITQGKFVIVKAFTVVVKAGTVVAGAWAKTAVSASNSLSFGTIGLDSSGNVYAGGTPQPGTFDFGNGVSATIAVNMAPLVIKYNAAGVPQWARAVSFTSGAGSSQLFDMKTDSAGNVYAVGEVSSGAAAGTLSFGDGVTISIAANRGQLFLVKYSASGTAVWARTNTDTAGSVAKLAAVALDDSGNIYAAGTCQGGVYTFETGVSITGNASGTVTYMVVKYNASGTAQWAKTIGGNNTTQGFAVACDSAGDVYVGARINGTNACDFGNSITLTLTTANDTLALVKYNAAGSAQWAKTVTTPPSHSRVNSLASDGTSIYMAAGLSGTGTYTFAAGVTAAGLLATPDFANAVLVKYNASGIAQWARMAQSGTGTTSFGKMGFDASGNIYVPGYMQGSGAYGFGNSVSAQGPYAGAGGYNALLVKYDASGTAQWARTASEGDNSSFFNAAAIGSTGIIHVSGSFTGIGSFSFGTGLSVTGVYSSTNPLLLKYEE